MGVAFAGHGWSTWPLAASSLRPDEYQKIKVNDMYFRFPASGLVCFRIIDPGWWGTQPVWKWYQWQATITTWASPGRIRRWDAAITLAGTSKVDAWLNWWMGPILTHCHETPVLKCHLFFKKGAFSWCGSSCYLHLRLCGGQRIQRDFIGHRRSRSFWGSVFVIFFHNLFCIRVGNHALGPIVTSLFGTRSESLYSKRPLWNWEHFQYKIGFDLVFRCKKCLLT